ncbi:MAG: NAD-dependent deacylase [Acidobacteriota bacterium]
MNDPSRESLSAALARSQRIAVMTGAGVSAESGVPTFRGAGGLWNGHRAADLATPEGFSLDPVLVWEFYDQRRTHLATCAPNPAHRALAALERRCADFTLITQNVDGLHQLAGSDNVLELHGNIWQLRCVQGCGGAEDRRAPLPRPLPPRCACGAAMRPGVVWFGESLPIDRFQSAAAAATRAELFLVIGTSSLIEPAASLTRLAHASGARVIEVNPDETPVSTLAHDVVRKTAAGALSRLVGQEVV